MEAKAWENRRARAGGEAAESSQGQEIATRVVKGGGCEEERELELLASCPLNTLCVADYLLTVVSGLLKLLQLTMQLGPDR